MSFTGWMTEDSVHLEVRAARIAAAVGAVAWVAAAALLRSLLGPIELGAVSIVGLPLTSLSSITAAEAGYRLRSA